MKQAKHYNYSKNPDVADAERRWLEAIDDKLGHAAINDRWNVVVAMRERAERTPFTRG